jgi:hypothetical protein
VRAGTVRLRFLLRSYQHLGIHEAFAGSAAALGWTLLKWTLEVHCAHDSSHGPESESDPESPEFGPCGV